MRSWTKSYDQTWFRQITLAPFQGSRPLTEEELRRDNWKWENCLHAEHELRGSSLQNPAFDIHYVHCSEGRDCEPDEPLNYAMIITVRSKRTKDLYNQVVRK